MTKMNVVRTIPPPRVLTPWADVLPGQWFERHSQSRLPPFMKTFGGGYVSLTDGYHNTTDSGGYPEVYVIPDGTEIVLTVGTRRE